VFGPAPDLLDRRLLFFTGKGGVGKSTMAAATALLAADVGKRVLLVEVDAKGDIPAQFEHAPVGFAAKEIHPGILALAMDTEASLQEYLRLNLRVPVIGRLGPLARVLDFVATAAPGVKEILTIGKIAWEVREAIEGRADFDLVVVDAAATGHIVAQLGASDAIRELVDVGPLRSQTQWVSDLLADPAITAVNVVTTPEEMPVAETIELVSRIRNEVDVPLGTVIVNRVLPELFTRADEETFEALRAPQPCEVLGSRAGPGALAVLDGARLAVSLRRTRAAHLEYLRESVDLPLLYVPYLFVRAHGLRVTRMVADALGAELGL
jgi:anion-transporting  ArsA/GET3 family ATPase